MRGATKDDAAIMAEFARRMVAARLAKGIKQVDLARLIGVAPGPINNLERGKSLPGSRMLRQICQHLDVSADHLLVLKPIKPGSTTVLAQRVHELEDRLARIRAIAKP